MYIPLPAHERVSFGPKRHEYVLVVPVLNEGERIRRQLERMVALPNALDIVIADGGSTDGSLDHAFLKAHGVRTLLIKTGEGRLGAQLQIAFAFALEEGYRGVILIDGNDKDEPSEALRFRDVLASGFDFVQGSRFVSGGQAIRNPRHRTIAIRLLHAPLISVASRRWYTDTTNGFRAYSTRFLADPRVDPFRRELYGYELHYYLSIRAARLGFKVKEIGVTRSYPASGPIPTKISLGRGSIEIMKALVGAVAGRFDPEDGS